MSPSNANPVAVLGAGTWGIVLAQLVTNGGRSARAWDFYPKVIDELQKTRSNPRLPGFKVSERVSFTADLGAALDGADVAVIVVPSTAVRSVCETIKKLGCDAGVRLWIIASKGIEQGTLLPLHEVVTQVFGEAVRPRVGVLGGPTHAEEVGRDLPATIIAAAPDQKLAGEIQQLFFHPRFRVYTQTDILGVELGGALKNVIAIAAGVSDGLGFGDNARAALITRGLAEMVRLGVAMGARRETFMGLSGLGDLVVTTSSVHSRNHRFGELLAEGKTCDQALAGVGMVVEGYATAQSAWALAKKFGIQMPITETVHRVLYEGMSAKEAIHGLLARGAKSEQE